MSLVEFNGRAGSAVSGVSGRMLEDMSSVRTGRGGGGEGTPSRYRAGKEGEQLVDSLQRLAGELTGHLAALSHRHHQLSMGADLSVRVTMDSLRQVSVGGEGHHGQSAAGRCRGGGVIGEVCHGQSAADGRL